jgi:integrase
MKRAAIYVRVSTMDQSTAAQVAELKEYANRRGWKIWKVYRDEGISGAQNQRPGLDELLADGAGDKVRHLGICGAHVGAGSVVSKVMFLNAPLAHPEAIENFKAHRLAQGVGPATVNRDLAVHRRILKIALRKRFITRNPFVDIEMLKERQFRRKAQILTFEEEERLLQVAEPYMRMLIILLTDTGLRIMKEALPLKWSDVDIKAATIEVKQSKTAAGERLIPLTSRCLAELHSWKARVGPEFSQWVFPNFRNPQNHLLDPRQSWINALATAGITYRRMYDLRATFASRLSAAGVSALFIAGLLGHSSTSILPTYAKVANEYRRGAIQKLEQFCRSRPASD